MFHLRHDQAPLRKQRIEDTPRDCSRSASHISGFRRRFGRFSDEAKYARMRTLMVPFGSSIIPRQKRQGRRFPFGFFPLRGFRRLRRTVADVMCPSASSKDQILRQNQQSPRRLLRRPIYFIIFHSLMSYCFFWPSFGPIFWPGTI